MSGLVLCPSCADDIGAVMKFFMMAKAGLIKKTISESKYKSYSPSMIGLSDVVPSVAHILDAIGMTIEKPCCRQHIMGARQGNEIQN